MTGAPAQITVGAAGHRLATRVWETAAPRGVVVIAHGHGEHGGCYAELAQTLSQELAVDIIAGDFRGHGQSTGRRGVVRRYEDLLDDLDSWLAWTARERPGLPVFVLGHSNGGLATIRLVETRQPPLAGLILSNPSLRLIADAPAWKLVAGRALLHLAPWVTLQTGISSDQLTQSPEKREQIQADPLRHRRISPPTYFGMVAHGPRAIAEADQITIPTCLVLGGADKVADPAAGRAFFDRLGATDKTLLYYDTMRHELIHEVERATVVAAMTRWLAGRVGPAPIS